MFWFVFESVFAAVFLVELVLRLIAQGAAYFKQVFNVIDAGLVTVGVVETWILTFTNACSHNSWMKVLLTLRVLRILRVIRFFKLVKSSALANRVGRGGGYENSPVGLPPTDLPVIYLRHLHDRSDRHCALLQHDSRVYDHIMANRDPGQLGGFNSASLTTHSPFLILFFLPFIFATTYGLFNVILGIVVEATVEFSASRSEGSRRETEIELQTALDALARILALSDCDDSGQVSLMEFLEISKLPEINLRLEEILNLEKSDIYNIFDSLADPRDPDKRISISELLAAVSQMSAPASSFQKDIGQVLLTMEGLVARLAAVEEQVRTVDRQIDHLCFKSEEFEKRTMYFLTGT